MLANSQELVDGLIIMGVGMVMVFLVLIALMGTIILLSKLFPEKEQLPVEDEKQGPREIEHGILAGIAAALSSIVPVGSRSRGLDTTSQDHNGSHWRLYGRRHLMDVSQHNKSTGDVMKFSSDLKRRRQLRGDK